MVGSRLISGASPLLHHKLSQYKITSKNSVTKDRVRRAKIPLTFFGYNSQKSRFFQEKSRFFTLFLPYKFDNYMNLCLLYLRFGENADTQSKMTPTRPLEHLRSHFTQKVIYGKMPPQAQLSPCDSSLLLRPAQNPTINIDVASQHHT